MFSDRAGTVATATETAARIAPGDGIVVHCRPLTVLATGPGDLGPMAEALTDLVDELVADPELAFGPVAAGLQQFVVAHQPSGVAAVLDLPTDPIVFLFDEAVAIGDHATSRAEGRAGWTTVFIEGHNLTLTVGAGDERPVIPWTLLHAGTVPGTTAQVLLTANEPAPPADDPRPAEAPIPDAPVGAGPIDDDAVTAGAFAALLDRDDDGLPLWTRPSPETDGTRPASVADQQRETEPEPEPAAIDPADSPGPEPEPAAIDPANSPGPEPEPAAIDPADSPEPEPAAIDLTDSPGPELSEVDLTATAPLPAGLSVAMPESSEPLWSWPPPGAGPDSSTPEPAPAAPADDELAVLAERLDDHRDALLGSEPAGERPPSTLGPVESDTPPMPPPPSGIQSGTPPMPPPPSGIQSGTPPMPPPPSGIESGTPPMPPPPSAVQSGVPPMPPAPSGLPIAGHPPLPDGAAPPVDQRAEPADRTEAP